MKKSESILQERKNNALNMIKEMKDLEKKQDRILNEWDNKLSKTTQRSKRDAVDNFYSKMSKEIENKQDALYSKYYGHVHKDFKPKEIQKNMTNYKEGFVDKKFINDMYNDKIKRKGKK